MSSQSGIVASEEVISSVASFVSSLNRALTLSIDQSNLSIDVSNIMESTNNLENDLDHISNNLLDNINCCYLLLNYDNGLAFISYVPDSAMVKSKMLYASTKNTLLRSLSQNFNQILFINSSNELSSDGWKKIIESFQTDGPLTESEINLQNVKNDELISKSVSSNKRSALVSDSNNNLLFKLDSNLTSSLSPQPNTLISLIIDNQNEILKSANNNNNLPVNVDSSSSLITEINKIEGPSYHLFTSGKGKSFFILSCPSGSKVRDRMIYAANKQGLLNYLKSNGWEFEKIIEVGDSDEIELSDFNDSTESSHAPPVTNNRLRFSKPKGPRKH